MYTRDNYISAKEEIERRRINAVSVAEARNEELCLRSDAIKRIDEELRNTGLMLFRTACCGGDITPIRERNEELMKERGRILVSLGYPEDYTDVHYTCEKCSDTGFVGTKMCSCLRSLLLVKNIASSGMGHLIEKQSFDNFDLEWYKTSSEEDYNRMCHNLSVAKAFANSFGRNKGNLLLIGSTGTGKTHISTAIAKEVINDGYSVIYDSVQNIIGDFETDKFKSGYDSSEPLGTKYLECDLLIIDDLGTEFSNQFTVSVLYNLLNTRQNRGLSTIISTNLTAEELGGKYEGRIYSRIIGSDYRVLFFSGKDRRIFK